MQNNPRPPRPPSPVPTPKPPQQRRAYCMLSAHPPFLNDWRLFSLRLCLSIVDVVGWGFAHDGIHGGCG